MFETKGARRAGWGAGGRKLCSGRRRWTGERGRPHGHGGGTAVGVRAGHAPGEQTQGTGGAKASGGTGLACHTALRPVQERGREGRSGRGDGGWGPVPRGLRAPGRLRLLIGRTGGVTARRGEVGRWDSRLRSCRGQRRPARWSPQWPRRHGGPTRRGLGHSKHTQGQRTAWGAGRGKDGASARARHALLCLPAQGHLPGPHELYTASGSS